VDFQLKFEELSGSSMDQIQGKIFTLKKTMIVKALAETSNMSEEGARRLV